HTRALRAAQDAVREFEAAWSGGRPPEISVTHLHDAVLALEDLLGVVTTEDVLETLFSTFCVGK
ncbi:MAG: tRNA uridine-5-carboxymethylaminomethyl(34) synthesis GTPase MnmE, partial [Gemmatimonadota bacterium]|nr:tRNA uridine-5-carboxymethylaminomethyl(34) synthesis GTPase MnmE [Gemmatimonadota bacterium]